MKRLALLALVLAAAGCGKKVSVDVSTTSGDAAAEQMAAMINPVVGTFTGSVNENGMSYSMTLVLNDQTGTIEYTAPFDCKGTWTQKSHDGKTWTYKEHITEQKGTKRCADGEIATLIQILPSQFQYVEQGAHATLTKH
jgi:hypothetical protein